MPFLPKADLWTRLNRNYARLEEAKYYPQNVYQREKEAEKWPGDTEGRTLLAWILLARATGRPPRYLDEMLAQWPAEINARGYFGKIYTDGISEQQLSSHGWVLQALAELHRAAGAGCQWARHHDARALAQPIIDHLFLPTSGAYADYPIDPAEREAAGEYSGSHAKQIGPWILSTDVGCFAIGMTGLIDACEAFAMTDRTRPLIEAMVDRFLAIDLSAIKAQTHATLTGLRGLARWSRMTDNSTLWAEIETRYQLYTDCAWTETHANYNWFGRPRWTEPCAVVDSLIVAMELWQQTGKSAYLEQAHLIWFNALGHGQRSNGGFGCDNCPGADGSTELTFSVPEAHWCCTMRGAEGLYRMCGYQVFPNEETLTLPFGLPGDFGDEATSGAHPEKSLRIESAYPHAAEWHLTNTGTHALTVRLFLPSWVEHLRTADKGVADHAHAAAFDIHDSFATLRLGPGERRSLRGTLVETTRHVLPATSRQRPETSALTLRQSGPLILARYGDDWKPIFQDYLRGDMSKETSSKVLLSGSLSPTA